MKFKLFSWFKKDKDSKKKNKDLEKTLTDRYETGKVLGSGSFAVVRQVTRKADGKDFAVKIIDRLKLKDKESMFRSEIKVLKKVHHRHIVCLQDLIETKAHHYLISDLATGGELFEVLLNKGCFTEADAARLVRQLLEALDYLHAIGCVHRDLKPENLLFRDASPDSDILITDFGLARLTNSNHLLTTCAGTPYYVSPEVLEQTGHSTPCDMWSLGVIVYTLLSGCMPFFSSEDDTSNFILYQNIMKGKYEYPEEYWGEISHQAKDFISRLLVVNPNKRMTAHEALSHPWLETTSTVDVLPNVRKNFNPKRTFKKAVLAVQSLNKMSSGTKTLFGALAESSSSSKTMVAEEKTPSLTAVKEE